MKVYFSHEAEASLGRLDRQVGQRILDRIKWLSAHAGDVQHKALTGDLKGAYKLRVGDYRDIYEINRSIATINVLLIGHRSEIYKQ